MYQATTARVEEANEAHHVQKRLRMLCTVALDMRKNDLALIPLYTSILYFSNHVNIAIFCQFSYLELLDAIVNKSTWTSSGDCYMYV